MKPNLADLYNLKPQVTELNFINKHANHASLAGSLISRVKGKGLEFEQVRKYNYGDDIRTIDWRVSARTGKTHIKEFLTEKESEIDIFCEISTSMYFASTGKFKHIIAAELVALLNFAGQHNKELLNNYFFGDCLAGLQAFRQKHLSNITTTSLNFLCETNYQTKAVPEHNLADALEEVSNRNKNKNLTFIICSFPELSKKLNEQLMRLASKKTVYLCLISDPLESDLPATHNLTINTPQGQEYVINLGDKAARLNYQRQYQKKLAKLETLCSELKITLLNIYSTDNTLAKLVKLL